MAKQKTILRLRIEQNGQVQNLSLYGKKLFSIGRSPANDLTLYGDAYPKQHELFVPHGDTYILRLPATATGEIMANKTRLRFADLIAHELLPRSNGYFRVEVRPGRMGYVFLDDTRIDFAAEHREVPQIAFKGFSPGRVFLKSLREDGLFRGIVSALLLLNIGALYAVRDYVPPPKVRAVDQATARLAKFVINAPVADAPVKRTVRAAEKKSSEAENKEETAKNETKKKDTSPERSTEPQSAPKPENLGVLALLGGTGQSNADNSVVDFLLSKDLAAGLNEVTRSKKLTVGKRGDGTQEATDDLLNAISTGGIDDILGGLDDGAESISLEKAGTVQVEQIGGVTGSEEALGARNEESLRGVLVENMGRLTYIYNKYLKRNPDFRGEIRLEVTISAAGQVIEVKQLSSTMGNPAFEREIIAAVKRFRFDPIATGIVRVEYPLIFNKIM